ncbi:hypothetical protein [Actinomadura sp. DC4]|uniref:hypothetical protein n=1 Tax=Actinomadura sp. DC4 TaxID=3055069 RepID=UPI0025AEEE13|nr:hypothetical protein [Actinomadura sp. DC4]MDN3356080.1 hypothetical protein [Actinomadura sp. DC4]
MSFDLGAVVPLSVSLVDKDGRPADATAMTVTITLPDGTTASSTVTSSPAGTYSYDYPTVQAGRHVVRWVATGANAGAFTDMFEVAPADPGALVSLADAKEQLNITGGSDDAELMRVLQSVTAPVERIVGSVVRRSWTETVDGGHPKIALQHFPVLSITQVAESGSVLAQSAYMVNLDAGVLTRVSGGAATRWRPGASNIAVTYDAGRVITGANVRQAVLVILQHLWDTQRGGFNTSPRDSDTYDPRFGYSIPRRALELLGEPIPGIA